MTGGPIVKRGSSKTCSIADPKMWADECLNAFCPSASLNPSVYISQSPTIGSFNILSFHSDSL